ncbi:MAG: AsmA-like C-terminal region-containing protein, partial [Candidatus Methylomirabilales bacterium]
MVSRRLRIATRILLGLSILLALAIVGLHLALSTAGVQQYLRRRIEITLSRRLEREVRIGAITVSPFLSYVELREITFGGAGQAPVFQRVGSVRFYPDPGRLLRGVPAVRTVVFLHPAIDLSGGLGLPRGKPGGWIPLLLLVPSKVQQALAVQVDRLQIRDGELTYRGGGRTWKVAGLDADLWRDTERVLAEVRIAEGRLRLPERSLAWSGLEAAIVLTQQNLEITRLALDVGKGHLGLSGRVRDPFGERALELSVTGIVPVNYPTARPESIRLEGQLTGPALAPHFHGSARLEGEAWPDLAVALSADREGLRGDRLRLLAPSGEASGGFELRWNDWHYYAWIRGRGLDLEQFVTPRGDRLPVTGSLALEAVAEGRGRRMRDLTAQAAVQVTALARRGRPSMVGRAEGFVKVERGQVSLARLQVDLPPNRLVVKGSLWETLDLEVSGKIPRVDLIGEFLEAKNLGGTGEVGGRVTGSLGAPKFQGTLTWDGPRLLGREFRQIRGAFLVEERTLTAPRLRVTKGESTATARLRLTLAETQAAFDLEHDLGIEAEGQVRGAPRDFLSLFVRRTIPLAGRMTLDARVRGVPARVEGTGHVRITDAVVLGEPWPVVAADLKLEPDRLLFEKVRLARGAEAVTGNGRLRFPEGTTTFRLATAGLSLDRFRLFAGTHLGGQIEGEMRGEGRMESPRIQADYVLTGLRYTAIPLGDGRGSMLLEEKAMAAQLALPDRGYAMQGTVRVLPPYPYHVKVTMTQADLAPLVALPGLSLLKGGGGMGFGTAELRGSLEARRLSQGSLELDAPSLRLHGLTFRTTEPIHLDLREDTVTVAPLAVTGKAGWLKAQGQIALRGGVDLDVRGKIPLEFLREQGVIADAHGAAELQLKVSGAWAAPRYQGGMRIQGAGLRLRGHPEEIQGIVGHMDLQGTKIRIPRLIGGWAGGTVKLSGTASRAQGRGWRWILDLVLDEAAGERVFARRGEKDEARVTGRTSLRGEVTAVGRSWEELQRSLRGKLTLALRDGKFRRFTVLANVLRIL